MEKWKADEQDFCRVAEDKAVKDTLPALMSMMTMVSSLIIVTFSQNEKYVYFIFLFVGILFIMGWILIHKIQYRAVRAAIYENNKRMRERLIYIDDTYSYNRSIACKNKDAIRIYKIIITINVMIVLFCLLLEYMNCNFTALLRLLMEELYNNGFKINANIEVIIILSLLTAVMLIKRKKTIELIVKIKDGFTI